MAYGIVASLAVISVSITGFSILSSSVSPSAYMYMRAASGSFRGCEARVSASQLSLFTGNIHELQFAKGFNISIWDWSDDNGIHFDFNAFSEIRNNETLCSQGFRGDQDLYGLGIRLSLYLQWSTSLLVNNMLPQGRHEFRKVYLVYSLALLMTTLVSSFSSSCTFAVEIEILYWAYWGGVLCMLTSSPSYTRLRSETKWSKLNWITGITYALHAFMFYHSILFWNYGYNQMFSRMPCGTYHFFFGPLLDPSRSFWLLRDLLIFILGPVTFTSVFLFPAIGLLLSSKSKEPSKNLPSTRDFANF